MIITVWDIWYCTQILVQTVQKTTNVRSTRKGKREYQTEPLIF